LFGAVGGVLRAGGANRGTDTIFGPGDRTFDTPDPTKRRSGGSKPAVTPRYGDRHDVRYTDQERLTSNVQLSTFNGVTERAHGDRDMETDTVFCRSAVRIEGQTRYLTAERSRGLQSAANLPRIHVCGYDRRLRDFVTRLGSPKFLFRI